MSSAMEMSRVMQGMESMMKEIIMECASKYNFDGEEAIREVLGTSVSRSMEIGRKKVVKEKVVKEKVVKEKVVKEKVVKEKESRGRPKKAPMEVESNVPVDLFASIVNEVVEAAMEKVEEDVDDLIAGLETMNVEEEKVFDKKEVERLKKEAEKAEKEAKRLAEKAEKEAKIQAAKAEKEAKIQAEKAEKEAKREAEKAKKEAEKALKESQKKPKKAAKSEEKVEEPLEKVEEKVEEPLAQPLAKVEAKLKVVRFEYNGVNYYKSVDTNILYDPVTKNEVGIWCEESKSIKELPEEDEEELEEEGYESD